MYKNIAIFVLSISLAITSLVAKEKSAEDLVKTMKKENITYAQLMSGMGMAYENILSGVLSMNKLLVDRGIDFIRTHPAPKVNPWFIMDESDHDGFKTLLVGLDEKMDEDVKIIENAVQNKDWYGAYEAANELGTSCLACHLSYKNNVKYIIK